MEDKFLNCLRIQIVPNHYEEERINSVADFCDKYGFRNVMLFINAEEYNMGHMTIEEAKPWVDTIKRAKKILVERGISVSLNPWIELGHLDRHRPLKQGQNFTTMVDYDGNKSETVVCPYCENWRKYYSEFYTYLLKEIEPDTVWVEDDFRLHNHGALHYGGCFCEEHMKRYNEKLGTNYTREEFTDLLFRKKADKKVRKAWLDVSRDCMIELAEFLGQTIKNATGCKVALMSSVHTMHAMEGRDWVAIHKALSQGGEMINRLHLPCYDEISSKEYYYKFNLIPYICRAFLPKQCKVLPELENGAFSSFTKDARFLQFQLESAIPLCIDGMTYDIFDFVGNGAIESFGYGQAVHEIEGYLNVVKKLSLKYETLEGIVCPIDEKSVYNREHIKEFFDFLPDEHYFYAYLNAIGFSTKITKQKKFIGKTVALSCGSVYNFTDTQLKELFADNFVIVEGGAAMHLIERGLGNLIKAKNCELQYEGVNSYEQVNGEKTINGMHGYRATMFCKAGNYVKLEYSEKVNALSTVFDYKNQIVGNGIVHENGFCVIPFVINQLLWEQFNDLRTTLLREIVLEKTAKIVSTNYAGVYAYLFERKKDTVLVLVNSTVGDIKNETVSIKGVDCRAITQIVRPNGNRKKVVFEIKGCNLSLPIEIKAMTTCVLVIK